MQPIVIRAIIRSNCKYQSATFDALPYFEQAADHELIALYDIGFRDDPRVEDVAIYCRDFNNGVDDVMRYVERDSDSDDPQGFEVVVDADSAIAWIVENRPDLAGGLSLASPNVGCAQGLSL